MKPTGSTVTVCEIEFVQPRLQTRRKQVQKELAVANENGWSIDHL